MRTLLLAAALAVAATPAFAIDFTQEIKQINGQPFIGPDGKPKIETLEAAADDALLTDYRDEPNLSKADKLKRYAIAEKIHKDPKNAQLSADEIATVEQLVSKAFNPWIVGEVIRLIDPGELKGN